MIKTKFATLGVASKMFALGTMALLSATYSKAAVISCPTSATSLSSINTSSTSAGCYDTDKTFSGLSVTNGSSGGVTQNTSTVALTPGSSGFNPTTLVPWSVSTEFTPAGAGDFTATSTGTNFSYGEVSTAGTMDLVINAGATTGATPKTGEAFDITTATLTAAAVLGNSTLTDGAQVGDTVKVVQYFCNGNVTCNAANAQATLTASFSNGSNTVSYSCTGGTIASCTTSDELTFIAFRTELSVATAYTVTSLNQTYGNGNSPTTSSLTDFEDVYGEQEVTPEPSTFALLGSAVVALALVQFRKRKHQV